MERLIEGVHRFQSHVYSAQRPLFERLVEGQEPLALFISCSDSRINPNLITQTDPGELFICRNAGNIVPPHSSHTGAMTASIEYAVGALKVPHIIICGHTHCGAMSGALHPETLDKLPHVREWLSHARAAELIARESGEGLSEEARLDLLTKENVLLQMAHIKTHPYVAAAVSSRRVEIHGWVYDIASGEILAFDEGRRDFIPVSEYYRDQIKSNDQQGDAPKISVR